MNEYFKKINYVNTQEVKEIIDICNNKLLLVINEIDIFFGVYESLKNVDNNVNFEINTINDVYKVLYDNLNKSYNLFEVREKFESILSLDVVVMKNINKIKDSMLNYVSAKNTARLHTYYAREIYAVYKKHAEEYFSKMKK